MCVTHGYDDGQQIIIRQNSSWTINVSSCLKWGIRNFPRKKWIKKNGINQNNNNKKKDG